MTDEVIGMRIYCRRCGYEVEFTQKDLDSMYNPSAECDNCGMKCYLSLDFNKGWVVKEMEKELTS